MFRSRALLILCAVVLAFVLTPAAFADNPPPLPTVDSWTTVDTDCDPQPVDAELIPAGIAQQPQQASGSATCSPCSQNPCKNKAWGSFCYIPGPEPLYGSCFETFTSTCQDDPVALYCQCYGGQQP